MAPGCHRPAITSDSCTWMLEYSGATLALRAYFTWWGALNELGNCCNVRGRHVGTKSDLCLVIYCRRGCKSWACAQRRKGVGIELEHGILQNGMAAKIETEILVNLISSKAREDSSRI